VGLREPEATITSQMGSNLDLGPMDSTERESLTKLKKVSHVIAKPNSREKTYSAASTAELECVANPLTVREKPLLPTSL
jgi:hypothetical protein